MKTLEVGYIYEDRIGQYIVVNVNTKLNRLIYRYTKVGVNDNERNGDLDMKIRIFEAIKAERARAAVLLQKEQTHSKTCVELVNYLLKHGWIVVKLAPRHLDKFAKEYREITNDSIDEESTSISLDENRWGVAICLAFTSVGLQYLPDYLTACQPQKDKDVFVISNNDFGWEMIRAGMRLGMCELRKEERRKAQLDVNVERRYTERRTNK